MGSIDDVRTLVISILNCHSGGITAHSLDREYEREINERLPFHRFGYATLDAFLAAELPDAVQKEDSVYGPIYFSLGTARTKHIVAFKPKHGFNYRKMCNERYVPLVFGFLEML